MDSKARPRSVAVKTCCACFGAGPPPDRSPLLDEHRDELLHDDAEGDRR